MFFGLKTLHYPYYLYKLDLWESTASLKELSTNLTSPKHSHVLSDTPSFRYMPYMLILAMFTKFTGLDVFSVMNFAAIFNFILLSVGIYLFIKEYFQDIYPEFKIDIDSSEKTQIKVGVTL